MRCPFCRSKAKVMHMDYENGVRTVTTVWGVFCKRDLKRVNSHGHFIDNYASEEEAVMAWNRAWERGDA